MIFIVIAVHVSLPILHILNTKSLCFLKPCFNERIKKLDSFEVFKPIVVTLVGMSVFSPMDKGLTI